jgi:hypothetical protein
MTNKTEIGTVYSIWNEDLNKKYPKVLENRDAWKDLGFDVKVTSDSDVRVDIVRLQNEIREDDFLDVFDRLETPMMQFDYWKYAKLFLDGGIYADVDVEPLQHSSLTSWMNMAQKQNYVVLFEETAMYNRNCSICHALRPVFSNYQHIPSYASCIMIAPGPRASFFLDLLRNVKPHMWQGEREPRKTLMSTGPGLLTSFAMVRDDVIFVGNDEGKLAYTHHSFGTWKSTSTYFMEKFQVPVSFIIAMTALAMTCRLFVEKCKKRRKRIFVPGITDEESQPLSKGSEYRSSIFFRKRWRK